MAHKKRTPRIENHTPAAADATATPDPFRRARELASKRLHGTRVGRLLNDVPERFERALDRALDRLGLVRKSKLAGARSTAGAQPA